MNKYFLFALGLPGFSLVLLAILAQGLPHPRVLLLPSAVILLLLVLNGLSVAAEFAISNAHPMELEETFESGNKTAGDLMRILASPAKQSRYIATAQLGITISSLGLGMYGEWHLSRFLTPYLGQSVGDSQAITIQIIASALVLSVLTYLHVVFAEMLPRSLALSASKRVLLAVAPLMRLLQLLFGVPILLLQFLGQGLLKLLRIHPVAGNELRHSPEELEEIVSESAEGGYLNEEEEEWILNIFNFSDRQAHQVMTPRPKIEAIGFDMPLPDILKLVADSSYSRFPVFKGDLDHIIGILHLKELARHQLNNGGFDLGELIQEVPVVPEYYPVKHLLTIFKNKRIHMAVVLDEFGGTAGIVTLEDLVEEIVGEVRDEFDKEPEPYIELEPGILEIDGSYLIDDLVDDLEEEGIRLDAEEDLPDVETVGGLIMAQLGRPPQLYDQVTYGQVTLTVQALDGLAVARARIEYKISDTMADDDNNDNAETNAT